MTKRDVWTPGRAFYMTAGEIEDGTTHRTSSLVAALAAACKEAANGN